MRAAALAAALVSATVIGGTAAADGAAPAGTPAPQAHQHVQGEQAHAHPHAHPTAARSAAAAPAPGGGLATARDPRFEQLTENVSPAAHVPFEQGTDMQFQRREGPHRRARVVVPGPRDYVFLGSDASEFASAGGTTPADGVGFRVVDVTNPRAPQVLAQVACTGHTGDVAVYENLLLQPIEREAPFYGFEGAPSNTGCSRTHDPQGLNVSGAAGVRVFDISDPARPVLVRFVKAAEFGGGGVHNVTVVPWAGLAYLSTFTLFTPSPRLVYLDLRKPRFPVTVLPMRSITPNAVNECHDIALDPARRLMFCGAFEQGHIWDGADPRRPRHITTMTNDGIFHYHDMKLAPDGRTLVIAAEQTGPDEIVVTQEVGAGGNSCVGDRRSAALWFYDLGSPAAPRLLGTFAPRTPMPTKGMCTSHLFSFIPGSDRLVTSWMDGGGFVVDYGRLPGLRGAGTPTPFSVADEQAWFLPVGATFWSAYYWHGKLYALGYGGKPGGGLWVMNMRGLPDLPPAPQDEGSSWARWTPRKAAAASRR